jgi:hypothetical protein
VRYNCSFLFLLATASYADIHVWLSPQLGQRVACKAVVFGFGSVTFRGGFGKLYIFPAVRRLCSGVQHVRQANVGGQVRRPEHTIFEPNKPPETKFVKSNIRKWKAKNGLFLVALYAILTLLFFAPILFALCLH